MEVFKSSIKTFEDRDIRLILISDCGIYDSIVGFFFKLKDVRVFCSGIHIVLMFSLNFYRQWTRKILSAIPTHRLIIWPFYVFHSINYLYRFLFVHFCFWLLAIRIYIQMLKYRVKLQAIGTIAMLVAILHSVR